MLLVAIWLLLQSYKTWWSATKIHFLTDAFIQNQQTCSQKGFLDNQTNYVFDSYRTVNNMFQLMLKFRTCLTGGDRHNQQSCLGKQLRNLSHFLANQNIFGFENSSEHNICFCASVPVNYFLFNTCWHTDSIKLLKKWDFLTVLAYKIRGFKENSVFILYKMVDLV